MERRGIRSDVALTVFARPYRDAHPIRSEDLSQPRMGFILAIQLENR